MTSQNILIVEDEAIVGLQLRRELEESGHTVCNVVATGEAAINCVREQPPDVVLMDIRLAGGIDGISAAREIRALYDIPIIFMTGYTDEEVVRQIQTFKMAQYLTKPLNSFELASAIGLACHRH